MGRRSGCHSPTNHLVAIRPWHPDPEPLRPTLISSHRRSGCHPPTNPLVANRPWQPDPIWNRHISSLTIRKERTWERAAGTEAAGSGTTGGGRANRAGVDATPALRWQNCRVTTIDQIRPTDSCLHVTWDDGIESWYPWLWLRDHAHDEATIHPVTQQRQLDTASLPADLRATAATADGAVARITWLGDTEVPSVRGAGRLPAAVPFAQAGSNRARRRNPCCGTASSSRRCRFGSTTTV